MIFQSEMIALVTDIPRQVYVEPERRSEFIFQMNSTGFIDEFEMHNLRKDGSAFWSKTNACAVKDANGKILYYEGFLTDITERKRMEEELRASEEKFRYIFDYSIIGKSLTLPNGEVNVNKALCDMLGYTQDEFKSKKWQEVTHPEDVDLTQKEIDLLLSGARDASRFIKRFIHKNGTVVWADLSSSVRRDKDGKALHLMTSMIDITERKRAEEFLRASEEKYRTVADFTYDWESWLSPDRGYLYVSPSCERISGYAAAEFLNDKNFLEKITHPDDKAKIREHFEAVTHKLKEQDIQIDFRIINPDGKIRWISHNCTAVYNANGEWIGRRESNRDITERKLAEEALQESNELLSLFMLHSPIYTYIKEVTPTESRVLQSSNNFQEMVGLSGKEMIGKTMKELFPPEFAAKMTADDWAVVESGEVAKLDEELNGRYYTTIKFPLKQGDKILLAGYTLDITERVEIEKALEISIKREKQLARTDALTGINNRRHLFELAEHEFEIAMRYRQSLSAILFDADYFKELNDTFGHALGDEMLQRVTAVACAELRSADVIGRYGGEEFVVILPQTDAQQAYQLAERIRMNAAAIRIATPKGDAAVTLSLGIAEIRYNAPNESAEAIIRRADEAMYNAKQAGRNRTLVF